MPISEYDTLRYGLAYEHTSLNTDSSTSTEILEFCADVSSTDDCQYDKYSIEAGWSRDSRNRAVFPDEGGVLSLTGNVGVPATDTSLSFYKVRLNKQHYFPLADWLTYSVEGEAAYADVYGTSNLLAPYDRYYAGGIRSVRGFRGNSLTSTEGTRDSLNDPLGGNARLLGKMEMLFPPPWDVESKSMRFMAFFDAGNVYNTDDGVDLDEIRYSTGVSMVWLTPVGPLTFSYAIPLNDKDGDEVEQFQFTLGTL
jgi:outer membrane protein insertion porin family